MNKTLKATPASGEKIKLTFLIVTEILLYFFYKSLDEQISKCYLFIVPNYSKLGGVEQG